MPGFGRINALALAFAFATASCFAAAAAAGVEVDPWRRKKTRVWAVLTTCMYGMLGGVLVTRVTRKTPVLGGDNERL